MKNISVFHIGTYLQRDIDAGRKNILFITPSLDYRWVTDWLKNNTSYNIVGLQTPNTLFTIENNIPVKHENLFVINSDVLDNLNDENVIAYVSPLAEPCIYNFEGYLKVVTDRFYVNEFSDGSSSKHSFEKLKMLIAFSTPAGKDFFALDEKYYELFDEVYRLDY